MLSCSCWRSLTHSPSSLLCLLLMLCYTCSHEQGELKGFDQTTNVILSHSSERVYSLDEGVEEVELGLYVVRGDNIVRRPFSSSV